MPSGNGAPSASVTPMALVASSAPSAPPAPLSLGPVPSGASPAERERRVLELLRGEAEAERLPLHDTDANTPYDWGLYRRLTTEELPSPTDSALARATGIEVRVGPLRLLSGELDLERARRTTAGMRAAFRNCYLRSVPEGNVPRHLSIEVFFRVSADGTVDSSRVEGKQLAGLGRLVSCLEARVMASQFEPKSGPAKVRFSLELTSTGPRAEANQP